MFVSIDDIKEWMTTGADLQTIVTASGLSEHQLRNLFKASSLDFDAEFERLKAFGKIQRLQFYEQALKKGNPAAVTKFMQIDFPDGSNDDESTKPISEVVITVVNERPKLSSSTKSGKRAKKAP